MWTIRYAFFQVKVWELLPDSFLEGSESGSISINWQNLPSNISNHTHQAFLQWSTVKSLTAKIFFLLEYLDVIKRFYWRLQTIMA